MSTTISYKGSTIATATNQTKTLKTAGKYMENDVVVTDVSTTINNQNKTVNPQTYQQSVTADSGYTGLGTVTVNAMATGTAGTPTATKGTVSNNSVTVTPSVTNTTGYITGGTKTGTGVTVSASELVSGTRSITQNGTGIDVTNYASVNVSVSGGGGVDIPTFTITPGTPVMVTCDKTYDEAESLFLGGESTARATSDGESYYSACVYDYSDELVYAAYEDGIPFGDIHYASNGTITFVTPSDLPSGGGGNTYTATITGTGNSTRCFVQHPGSSGTKYYTNGDTFTFQAGESLYCYTTYNNSQAQIITVNGETVQSGTTSANYTYTLPAKDIKISLTYSRQGSVAILESIIPNSYRQATTYTPRTTNLTIPANIYLAGAQTISGDSNLVAGNIKNGVSIFGVTGTYDGGGGGGSPVITGTFTTNASSGVQQIDLSYTGSGYPIMFMLYPTGGIKNTSNTAWYSTINRYKVGLYMFTKNLTGTAPVYGTSIGNANNIGTVAYVEKNSASDATSTAAYVQKDVDFFSSYDPSSSANVYAVHMSSATNLSVYVGSTDNGLQPSTSYTYWIVYSS